MKETNTIYTRKIYMFCFSDVHAQDLHSWDSYIEIFRLLFLGLYTQDLNVVDKIFTLFVQDDYV